MGYHFLLDIGYQCYTLLFMDTTEATMMTKDERNWMRRISSTLVTMYGAKAAGMLAADPVAAVKLAHAEIMRRDQEILAGRTERAQAARAGISAAIYIEAVRVGTVAQLRERGNEIQRSRELSILRASCQEAR